MTLPERRNQHLLYVDLNSFFASCEQADQPELRGKPVIVVPTEGSCALAASYEAKAFGVKTGTLEREARFLCPAVQVVKARPKRYMEYHYRFETILHDLAPNITVRSVDEASIRLCRNEEPWQLGRQIKERLWAELGPPINCSIGIAPNLFLAKLATELQKPNGLVEIGLEDLPNIYRTVTLRDLCGINYAMERQLQRVGIYSVVDFYQTDALRLRQLFGVWGYRWWLQLHGYASYDFVGAPRKTLSHSHVLPPALRQPPQAYTTLQRLITKVGRRLRREGCRAGRVALFVRFADYSRAGLGLRITPASDTLTLASHINRLWQTIDPQLPVKQLAIWTNDLVDEVGMPMPLFPAEQKQLRLSRALDTINDRFGTDTIRFAILDTAGSHAPDRISFTALFPIEHE